MKRTVSVPTLTITPFYRRNLLAVRDLLFRSQHIHVHLDWFETEQWLESNEAIIRLAWQNSRLVAILGASKPLNQTSWVRLASVADQIESQSILCALWEEIVQELKAANVHTVGLLIINDWISQFVISMGFMHSENIITMARAGNLSPLEIPSKATIRVAEISDVRDLAEVDQKAFDPPWQMSQDEVRQAYRMATSCTVAMVGQSIVGYQISTLYFDGAHLARLAVIPEVQGKGIGKQLLAEVLQRYFHRGVYMMTVNTQSSNAQSRHLYERFGFEINGHHLPYWYAKLS